MDIPVESLSPEALQGIIEAFVLREGTDYGSGEHSLEQKVQQVRSQLERGRVKIVYDEDSESCDIVVARD